MFLNCCICCGRRLWILTSDILLLESKKNARCEKPSNGGNSPWKEISLLCRSRHSHEMPSRLCERSLSRSLHRSAALLEA